MCLPKAPKEDPEIARQQAEQRRLELERLAEEKKKDVVARRRSLPGSGTRSLLASGNTGSGFGRNY
jgi:hypothetical protein